MSAWIIKVSLMPAFCAEYLFMIVMIILWEQTLIYLCTSCILLTQRDNGMYTKCFLMCGLHYIHTVHNRSLTCNCSLHFRGQSWDNRQTERVATWLHYMCCNLFFSHGKDIFWLFVYKEIPTHSWHKWASRHVVYQQHTICKAAPGNKALKINWGIEHESRAFSSRP